MATPTIAATKTSFGNTDSPASVGIPAHSTGDLLFFSMVARRGAGGTRLDLPAGWEEVVNESFGSTAFTQGVFCHLVDGTEGWAGDGTDTLTVTGVFQHGWCACGYALSGAEDPAVQAPSASAFAAGKNNSPNPDIVSPGSTEDFLYIVSFSLDDNPLVAMPSGYTTSQIGAFGANASQEMAAKPTTATSSDDPGAATGAGNPWWGASTVAIWPSTAVPAAPAAGWGRVPIGG